MSWKTALATSPAPTSFGPLLFAGRVQEAARVAGELGYDGIEISLRSVEELEKHELASCLRENGLRLSALGSGRIFLEDRLSLSDPTATVRAAALARLSEHIEFAADFDSALIIGLVRGAHPTSPGGLSERRRIAEGLRECAERALELAVEVLFEPINRYETAFQNRVAESLELLREVESPNMGLLLDVFHMNIEEASIGAAIREAGCHLRYLHFSDSNRWAAGFGHVDYGEIHSALEDIGFAGWLGAEVLPRPDDLAAATQAKRFVTGFGAAAAGKGKK